MSTIELVKEIHDLKSKKQRLQTEYDYYYSEVKKRELGCEKHDPKIITNLKRNLESLLEKQIALKQKDKRPSGRKFALTPKQEQEIYTQYVSGKKSTYLLADEYKVNLSTIYRAIKKFQQ